MRLCLYAFALLTASGCGSTPDPDLPEPAGAFPDGFLWGTATAPYQIEGQLHDTDWYQWETLCDSCSGESADSGPDFLSHYDEDFASAAAMSNNAVRLGIEWSRVFPTAASFPDSPDPDAVQLYHDVIDSARGHGLDVMVTLVHFSLPIWLHDMTDPAKNGWEDPATIDAFATWAGWAAGEYGSKVTLWVTLNEPLINVVGGWIAGEVPPGKSFEIDLAFEVAVNMIRAHARGYDAIHAADSDAQVSIAKHNRIFLPKDPDDPDHVRATEMLRYLLNDVFLDGAVDGNIDANYDFDHDDPEDTRADPDLVGRMDYIGLNYYGVTLVVDTANDANFPMIGIPLFNDLDRQGLEGPISDFGWTIYPQGLREIFDGLQRYELPIIITENGVADGSDALRPRYLLDHLYEINRAIDDGIDIRGYYHWSLIDNFEWGSGYCPRFGLLRVDFDDPSRPRTAGPGVDTYRQIIDANTVEPRLFAEHPEYPGPGFCARVGF